MADEPWLPGITVSVVTSLPGVAVSPFGAPGTVLGVAAMRGVERTLQPAAFSDWIEIQYVVPLVRPVTVHDVVSPTARLVVVVQVLPSWVPPVAELNAVAWPSVIAEPSSPGTVQLTATWPFSAFA